MCHVRRQGLIFSVGLSLLPIIIAGLGWVARVVSALSHLFGGT